jgi:flagellar hook-basal body complex protein FliE
MNPIRINVQPQEIKLLDMPSPQPRAESAQKFKDVLSEFVGSVSKLQRQAGAAEQSFLKGEIADVHQVMIAVEEAAVAFELLMEVRNKLLESYQQIMRMPM